MKNAVLSIILCFVYFAPNIVFAVDCTPNASGFVPLACYNDSPQLQNLYSTDPSQFSTTFNDFWLFALSIGGFLAVIKLVQAGFLYQGGDYWDKKQRGKEILQDVILGLIILFGIYLILYQINPCILDLSRLLNDFGSNPNAVCSPTI